MDFETEWKKPMSKIIFKTNRLLVKTPELTKKTISFITELWNTPAVMKYVGFPPMSGNIAV